MRVKETESSQACLEGSRSPQDGKFVTEEWEWRREEDSERAMGYMSCSPKGGQESLPSTYPCGGARHAQVYTKPRRRLRYERGLADVLVQFKHGGRPGRLAAGGTVRPPIAAGGKTGSAEGANHGWLTRADRAYGMLVQAYPNLPRIGNYHVRSTYYVVCMYVCVCFTTRWLPAFSRLCRVVCMSIRSGQCRRGQHIADSGWTDTHDTCLTRSKLYIMWVCRTASWSCTLALAQRFAMHSSRWKRGADQAQDAPVAIPMSAIGRDGNASFRKHDKGVF